jgi:hypothetical protein
MFETWAVAIKRHCPSTQQQMPQTKIENKYRLNMQVSSWTMAGRDDLAQRSTAASDSDAIEFAIDPTDAWSVRTVAPTFGEIFQRRARPPSGAVGVRAGFRQCQPAEILNTVTFQISKHGLVGQRHFPGMFPVMLSGFDQSFDHVR